jgi:hypothetical protein
MIIEIYIGKYPAVVANLGLVSSGLTSQMRLGWTLAVWSGRFVDLTLAPQSLQFVHSARVVGPMEVALKLSFLGG